MKNSFVVIKVVGVNLDALIAKLYASKFKLINIKRKEHKELTFTMQYKDYMASKNKIFAGYSYEIVKEYGIKHMINLLKNNIFALVCVAICCMLFIFSSTFVWDIKFEGLNQIPKAEILQVLKKHNVQSGKMYLCNSEELELILLNEIEDIAQISVNKQGNLLLVNISEKVKYVTPNFEPVVSEYAGIITYCNLISGSLCVKVGDYVNEGDILVQPYIYDANGNQVAVQPLAEIKARAYIVGEASLKANDIKMVRTGKKIYCSDFYLFEKKIFSNYRDNKFANFEIKSYNVYVSALIPILRVSNVYYELKSVPVSNNLEQNTENIVQLAKQKAYQKAGKIESIVNETLNYEIINEVLYANCALECEIYIT